MADNPDYLVAGATFASTLFGLGAVYIQHLIGERNRRIRIANALRSEISVIFGLQYADLQASREAIFRKAAIGTERFTAWGGVESHNLYRGSPSDILLLDDDRAVRAVIAFYERDSYVNGTVMNMGSESFHALPAERKLLLVEDLFNNQLPRYFQEKELADRLLEKVAKNRRIW